jgi:hypothetical protein
MQASSRMISHVTFHHVWTVMWPCDLSSMNNHVTFHQWTVMWPFITYEQSCDLSSLNNHVTFHPWTVTKQQSYDLSSRINSRATFHHLWMVMWPFITYEQSCELPSHMNSHVTFHHLWTVMWAFITYEQSCELSSHMNSHASFCHVTTDIEDLVQNRTIFFIIQCVIDQYCAKISIMNSHASFHQTFLQITTHVSFHHIKQQ